MWYGLCMLMRCDSIVLCNASENYARCRRHLQSQRWKQLLHQRRWKKLQAPVRRPLYRSRKRCWKCVPQLTGKRGSTLFYIVCKASLDAKCCCLIEHGSCSRRRSLLRLRLLGEMKLRRKVHSMNKNPRRASWMPFNSTDAAKVTFGDGTVQKLCVGASDRCKDAAERFISENSLKAALGWSKSLCLAYENLMHPY